MEILHRAAREIRYAARKLLTRPGSTLVAVFAMALGIALTAAMFSILDGVYLRGLPFEESNRLYHLEYTDPEEGQRSVEVREHDLEEIREQQETFEGLAGFTSGTFNLADDDALPERYDGAWISTNFLDLVRVEPILGRAFGPADDEPGAPPVLLVGYHVWKKRWGGDPSVVGKTVRLNGQTATMIGVLPEGFRFPVEHDMWMPLVVDPSVPREEGRTLEVFGRLADGVSPDEAQTGMSLVARRLAEEYPETNEGMGAVVKPLMDEYIDETTIALLGVMMTAVVLVLLLACFNVANLLIGRASTRGRELAIRSAMGSGRWEPVRQVLTEAALIATAGAALGLVLARWAAHAFDEAIRQIDPGFWVDVYVGPRTILVTVAATALAALVSGLVPAFQASKPDVTEALQDTGRGSTSFRMGWVSRVLVVAQVAVSAALLVGAFMTVRSILAAQSYELKFDEENLLVARLGLFEGDYPEPEDRAAFFERVQERLGGQASVESVAVGTVVPTEVEIGAPGNNYERPGEEYEKPWQMPWARLARVSPGYFDTLGVQVVTGRDFTVSDRAETPRVAIVNQDFALEEWGDENPLGQTIDLWMGEEAEGEDPTAGVVRVVGVVPDLRFADFDDADDQQAVYVPMAQDPMRFSWVIVRTKGDPMAFSRTLRSEINALDPDLPLYFVSSMEQVIERTLFMPNLLGSMFGTFGVAALFLACVGLFGLMSFAVTQRTQEMGVRMALGARAREVLGMVIGQGLKQTLVGLVIGLLLGVALSAFLGSILYSVGTGDPITLAIVAVTLLAVAVASSLWPAIRASRVDPMEALRYE